MSKKKSWLIIISMIVLLQLPMIWNHSVNLGGDALFHYNRVYDAMMQMKNHNFQPLYTFYGFNSTVRVINALYGPVIAYFLGCIAWISGSWFKFDIIVNVILGLSISLSFWKLFNMQKINNTWRVLLVGIILISNNYLGWILQHQFNVIGAVPLILVAVIIFRMYEFPDAPIRIVELSITMTLLLQVHMLSTLMALLLLIPTTIFASFWWTEKKKYWVSIFMSGALTIFSTMNVWWPYLYITSHNTVSTPGTSKMSDNVTHFFVNDYAWNGTVNWVISLIIFITLTLGIVLWHNMSRTTHVFTILGVALLILQTNIIPWDKILYRIPSIAIIQFPFRFGFILMIIVIVLIGQFINYFTESTQVPLAMVTVSAFVLVGLLISYNNIWQWNANYHQDVTSQIVRNPVNGQIGSTADIKQDFLSDNMQSGLLKSSRGSTDYLTGVNKDYSKYNNVAFLNQKQFEKKISPNKIVLRWNSSEVKNMSVPISVYDGLQLRLNGSTIPVKSDNLGFVVTKSRQGINTLIAQQKTPKSIFISYLISMLSWISLIIYICLNKYKHNK